MFRRLERNAPCWCGSGKKYKSCHLAFDEKIMRYERMGHIVPSALVFLPLVRPDGDPQSEVI